jgi:hypothetical protein
LEVANSQKINQCAAVMQVIHSLPEFFQTSAQCLLLVYEKSPAVYLEIASSQK